MKYYTKHLVKEIELIEGAKLTTEQGHMVEFRFQLIPADMKQLTSVPGELNTCAIYFSPFANVNQIDKTTISGSIAGPEASWQPWDYKEWILVAEKVRKLEAKLRDPEGKQRAPYVNQQGEIQARICSPLGQICGFS